jgi:hypothetical protein
MSSYSQKPVPFCGQRRGVWGKSRPVPLMDGRCATDGLNDAIIAVLNMLLRL